MAVVPNNTSHSTIWRRLASPLNRWPAWPAFSDCRAASSRTRRLSSVPGTRTASACASASRFLPTSSNACATE